MHSYLKPLDGQPLSPPHIVVQSLKKKKGKKKSTSLFPGVKETVYLKAHWLSGLRGTTGPSPLAPPPAHGPRLPPERRSQAKSPRVGLSGPIDIKMELVKENVKKKRKKKKPNTRGKSIP